MIAEVGIKAETLCRCRDDLELDTAVAVIGEILGDEGRSPRHRVDERRRRLQVLRFEPEPRQIDAQPPVKKRGLGAEFIAPDLFGVEGQQRVGRRAARIPAARFEAARRRGEKQHVVVGDIIQRETRRPHLGALRRRDAHRADRHVGRIEAPCNQRRTQRPVVGDGEGLFLIGITDAGGQLPLRAGVEIGLDIACLGRRGIAQGPVGEEEAGAEDIGEIGRIVFIEVEGSGDIIDRAAENAARRLDFLAELAVLAVIDDGEAATRETRHRRRRVGDIGQAATIGEIERIFLAHVDIAGDEADVERLARRPFDVRCVDLGVDPVAEPEKRLSPGHLLGQDAATEQRHQVERAGIGTGGARREFRPEAGGGETPGAIARIAWIAIEIGDILAIVAHICRRHVPGQRVGPFDLDGTAQARHVAVVQPFAGRRVVYIAVVILEIARNLGLDKGIGRQVDRAADQFLVIGTIGDLHVTADGFRRALEHDVDRAAGGVAPEQRALRPAQHLDAIDVEKGEVVAVLPRHVDVVDISADRRIEGGDSFGIAQAADIIGVCRSKAGVVRSEHVGDIIDQLQRCRDAALRQRIGRKGTDRDRHRLLAFTAALRGDDDVGDGAIGVGNRRRGLRHRGPAGGEDRCSEKGAAQRQSAENRNHAHTPNRPRYNCQCRRSAVAMQQSCPDKFAIARILRKQSSLRNRREFR